MSPSNALRQTSINNVFHKDFGASHGAKSAKSFMKRECRRIVRHDSRADINSQLDILNNLLGY